MVELYLKLVLEGKRTIEEVPAKYRKEVETKLENNQLHFSYFKCTINIKNIIRRCDYDRYVYKACRGWEKND